MSYDRDNSNATQDGLINTDNPLAVRDWARSMGVRPEQVKAAVMQVGPSARKVRDYLWELGE